MAELNEKLEQNSVLLKSDIRSWWVLKIMKPVEDFCIWAGLTPNKITLIAVAFSIGCFLLFGSGHILTGGWMVLFTGSLDFLDGRVARATNQVTVQGGFFDSVADRFQDFFIFSGLCLFYRHDPWMAAVVLMALGGSMMVSYVRSKADNVGVDLSKIGEMQRPERIFLLGFGSIVSSMFQVSLMPFYSAGHRPPQHLLKLVLIFMAISNNWTAIKRIRYTMKALS